MMRQVIIIAILCAQTCAAQYTASIWPAYSTNPREVVSINGTNWHAKDAWPMDLTNALSERITNLYGACSGWLPTNQYYRYERANLLGIQGSIASLPYLTPWTSMNGGEDLTPENRFNESNACRIITEAYGWETNCASITGGASSPWSLSCSNYTSYRALNAPSTATVYRLYGTNAVYSRTWSWDASRLAIGAASNYLIRPYFKHESNCGSNMYFQPFTTREGIDIFLVSLDQQDYEKTDGSDIPNAVTNYVLCDWPEIGQSTDGQAGEWYTAYAVDTRGSNKSGTNRLYIKADSYLTYTVDVATCTATITYDKTGSYSGDTYIYGGIPLAYTVTRTEENSSVSVTLSSNRISWSANLGYDILTNSCGTNTVAVPSDGGVVEFYVDFAVTGNVATMDFLYD